MYSLAVLTVILLFFTVFSGPITFLLAKIKTKSMLTLILKRFFMAVFTFTGNFLGLFIIAKPGIVINIKLIGVMSICLCYIGTRNEYFPNFRLLKSIAKKTGRSKGNDGHGPEGQH
jgi:hypothetical protein